MNTSETMHTNDEVALGVVSEWVSERKGDYIKNIAGPKVDTVCYLIIFHGTLTYLGIEHRCTSGRPRPGHWSTACTGWAPDTPFGALDWSSLKGSASWKMTPLFYCRFVQNFVISFTNMHVFCLIGQPFRRN